MDASNEMMDGERVRAQAWTAVCPTIPNRPATRTDVSEWGTPYLYAVVMQSGMRRIRAQLSCTADIPQSHGRGRVADGT